LKNFVNFYDLGIKAIANSDAEHRVTYALIRTTLEKEYVHSPPRKRSRSRSRLQLPFSIKGVSGRVRNRSNGCAIGGIDEWTSFALIFIVADS
jgi:hypothetical protein